MIKLYGYFRSSAAYRVRIALNSKSLSYESHEVHLLKNGGEQNSAAYLQLNPQGLVPTLIDNEVVLSQSVAILEYLEEQYPEHQPLLPVQPLARAKVRQMVNLICCDIHPLDNLRVLNYLQENFHASAEQKKTWYQHWIVKGFSALENMLQQHTQTSLFCYGDTMTLADCCLVPQVYNAKRFDCPLTAFPAIMAVYQRCLQIDAVKNAAPELQAAAEGAKIQ